MAGELTHLRDAEALPELVEKDGGPDDLPRYRDRPSRLGAEDIVLPLAIIPTQTISSIGHLEHGTHLGTQRFCDPPPTVTSHGSRPTTGERGTTGCRRRLTPWVVQAGR